jgi:DNA-binding NarL/FixJ family response regulator
MTATRLQWRDFEPHFSEGQWLRIAERLEMSRRELEIVRLLFQGAQDKIVARELAISINTCRTHLKRLYTKLGVTSRVELVLEIVREHQAGVQFGRQPESTVLLRPGVHRAA